MAPRKRLRWRFLRPMTSKPVLMGAIIDYVQDGKNLGWTRGIKNGDTETALERRVNSIR